MAATGTPTPNIGLRIPIGTDPASVDDINYNSNLLDTKLGAVGSDSVQDQIDTLNGKLTRIYKKTITGTTTATGALDSQIDVSNYYIISAALSTGGGTAGFAFWRGNDGYLHCFNVNMTVMANASVSIDEIYCLRSDLLTQ